ncbi:uncharacterized protein ATC70_009869 [Mucor velutinosus]|uniref:Uncharacterized protein n=1 Tax=Mucor velutinosus TaxID=708070 RepID=A0AAN7DLK6_9FUNG|nr:hypothetical protein ATC70_009869 [Mucor velutinosus]
MTISNIRDHPYHFEHALQQSNDYKSVSVHQIADNFTWLVFINAKWVPFASFNQHRLEQTLGLGGTFVDIEDRLFPGVKRVRVFPKANYLSYLGVKYRLSRVMQPHQLEFGASSSTTHVQGDEEDESNDPAMNRILQHGIIEMDSNQYHMPTRVS